MDATSSNNVIVYPFHGDTNQQWRVKYQGNGFYKLYSMQNCTPKKLLHVDGDNVDVYTSGDFLLFRIIKNSDGTYRLMNTARGNGTKALDVNRNPNSPDYNKNVIHYNYGGSDNQKWLFEEFLINVGEAHGKMAVQQWCDVPTLFNVYFDVYVFYTSVGSVKTIKKITSKTTVPDIPGLLDSPANLQRTGDLVNGSSSGITGSVIETSGYFDATQYIIYESNCNINGGTTPTVTLKGSVGNPKNNYSPALFTVNVLI